MMDILLLSFYVACAVVPAGVVVYMIFRLIYRKSYQVILCMECDQCKRVCPVSRKKGASFAGPKEIMAAVKSGNVSQEIIAAALLCTGCGLCQRACPRGLAPYREIEKITGGAARVKLAALHGDIPAAAAIDDARPPFAPVENSAEDQKQVLPE